MEQAKPTTLFINFAAIIIILAAVKFMEPIISPFLISIWFPCNVPWRGRIPV